ncbi:hypothetical protein KIN20_011172 [Parelaphostrongylus tenuis]|uniref:Uncharacterized protein n=1 Tax=Parelaphostrongylus tenuis TaxID=148309 RepID=A0AAD5MV13_PARTN|nr:hypothetical protein KIN20_011172 [Parelaphostrongylus tenuis]
MTSRNWLRKRQHSGRVTEPITKRALKNLHNREGKIDISVKMVGHSSGPFMILMLATISTLMGCGVMPPGQGSTPNLHRLWLHSACCHGLHVDTQCPFFPVFQVAREQFRHLCQRLVMQTVFDVLESQARSALLPDAVISIILGQLSLTISYRPMSCNMVVSPGDMLMAMAPPSCVIVGNTVTGVCSLLMPDMAGACTNTAENEK